jgi:S-adenosylmethionine:tRNA ribosyltransferase-isomerase
MSSDERPQPFKTSDFDYDLPQELIAQTPLTERDSSRLMIVEREHARVSHASIRDLPSLLRHGDLVVVNNTRVLPARIFASKAETGGRVELLLLHRDPSGVWTCLGRPAKGLRSGQRLLAEANDGGEAIVIEVVSKGDEGEVGVRFVDGGDIDLHRIGAVPLPPYIRAPLAKGERYQTVYARIPGSAAAPTAGLHITDRLREELTENGVQWAEVTLHIGLDTFRPITVETISEHKIHREWCSLPPEVAKQILATKQSGGRVVAVGTTSARTLETWALKAGSEPENGFEGWADLFITPGYRWQVVDAMLTNFHLPRSTLLLMISAFAGVDLIRQAYADAIENRYRFYSFGDAMLIV